MEHRPAEPASVGREIPEDRWRGKRKSRELRCAELASVGRKILVDHWRGKRKSMERRYAEPASVGREVPADRWRGKRKSMERRYAEPASVGREILADHWRGESCHYLQRTVEAGCRLLQSKVRTKRPHEVPKDVEKCWRRDCPDVRSLALSRTAIALASAAVQPDSSGINGLPGSVS